MAASDLDLPGTSLHDSPQKVRNYIGGFTWTRKIITDDKYSSAKEQSRRKFWGRMFVYFFIFEDRKRQCHMVAEEWESVNSPKAK